MPADLRIALALAACACGAAAGSGVLAQDSARPVEPFILDQECIWWMSVTGGRELRASISGSYSDEDPVLTIADPAFLRIGEEARPKVTLRIDGQRARTVRLESWSTHVGTETAMLGMYLDAKARRVLGGAQRLEIVTGGKVLLDLPLAGTPSATELDACVLPKPEYSDSE